MIDCTFGFCKIFVLCNLDLWFKSYDNICKDCQNMFGPIC